jgi:hypothetical protein
LALWIRLLVQQVGALSRQIGEIEEAIAQTAGRWLIKSGTGPAAKEGVGWFKGERSILGWKGSDAHSPQADGTNRRGD